VQTLLGRPMFLGMQTDANRTKVDLMHGRAEEEKKQRLVVEGGRANQVARRRRPSGGDTRDSTWKARASTEAKNKPRAAASCRSASCGKLYVQTHARPVAHYAPRALRRRCFRAAGVVQIRRERDDQSRDVRGYFVQARGESAGCSLMDKTKTPDSHATTLTVLPGVRSGLSVQRTSAAERSCSAWRICSSQSVSCSQSVVVPCQVSAVQDI
jgi:hypothetical protein